MTYPSVPASDFRSIARLPLRLASRKQRTAGVHPTESYFQGLLRGRPRPSRKAHPDFGRSVGQLVVNQLPRQRVNPSLVFLPYRLVVSKNPELVSLPSHTEAVRVQSWRFQREIHALQLHPKLQYPRQVQVRSWLRDREDYQRKPLVRFFAVPVKTFL